MPQIGELTCTTESKNTGIYGCPLILKRAKQLLIEPVGTKYTAAQTASGSTSNSTLRAALLADAPASRSYLLPVRIGESNDATGDPKRLQFAYGSEYTVYDSNPIVEYMIDTRNANALFAMQQFNNAQDYIVSIIDEDDKIIGTTYTTGGVEYFTGYSTAQIYAGQLKQDVGEGVKYGIRVVFRDANEMNNGNLRVWATGINTELLPRMNSLVLSEKTAPNGSRIVDVKVMVGQTNFATTAYGTRLAVTGAWKAQDTAAAAIAISNVAIVTVSGDSVYRITLASTNYPSSGNDFYLDLQLPSVLAALGTPLEGFESTGYLTETAA
jgi:hypothetical protein